MILRHIVPDSVAFSRSAGRARSLQCIRRQCGLTGFVEGRVQRGSQIRIADQTERKLAAIEALSRYGLAAIRSNVHGPHRSFSTFARASAADLLETPSFP